MISSTSRIPLEQVGPKCTKCLSFGHVFQECDQEQRCLKCTKVGHIARDCMQCSWCLKCGHKEEVCYSKQRGNQWKEKRRRAVQNKQLTTEQSGGMEQVHEDKNTSSNLPSNQQNEKPVDEAKVFRSWQCRWYAGTGLNSPGTLSTMNWLPFTLNLWKDRSRSKCPDHFATSSSSRDPEHLFKWALLR